MRVNEKLSGLKPMLDSLPENFTTCRTPAALAASMKVHCVSYIAGVADEINSARSTPSSAPESVSGFCISPCTTSTLARSLMAVALEASRTKRPNLDALTGEFPHSRLTVVSRCARNQDHGCPFVEAFLTPTPRISKFATDLAKAGHPR